MYKKLIKGDYVGMDITGEVDLPTPPFWFAIATTLPMWFPPCFARWIRLFRAEFSKFLEIAAKNGLKKAPKLL